MIGLFSTVVVASAFAVESRLGDTDCEAFHDGFWAQPANAVSSLAYTLVGVAVIWWGVRRATVKSSDAVILGIALALTGLGSVDFHGPATSMARFFHDGTIGLVVLFMISFDLGILRSWRPARTYWLFALLSVVLAAPLLVEPDSSIPVTGLGVVALVVVDVAVLRSGRRPLRDGDGAHRRFAAYVTVLAALAVAGLVNVASRTDAPLCDPDSLVQGHGIWHVLTAIAFGAWAVAALPRYMTPAVRTDHESDSAETST